MNRFFRYTIVVIAMLGFMSLAGPNSFGPGNCAAAEMGPVLSVATPVVKMSKKSEVVIMGTGFKPGQELFILFTTVDGYPSDIGYALKPAPKADQTGSFVTTWSAGRYVSKKFITGGAYKIEVTNLLDALRAKAFTQKQLDRLGIGRDLQSIPWAGRQVKLPPSKLLA